VTDNIPPPPAADAPLIGDRAERNLMLALALVVFVAISILYTQTRVAVHSYDAVTYMIDIEHKGYLGLFHPHHLLYSPLGRAFVDLWRAFGYAGAVDQPLQLLNALAGAGGVLLLWAFGVAFTGRRWLSLPIALAVGGCYGYWLYASEVEVYTFAALFIALCLWLMAQLERAADAGKRPRGLLIALGMATGGAVMFHQTNVLLGLPISVWLLLDARLRRGWLWYASAAGAAIALPYVAVALTSGLTTWDSFYNWARGYVGTGRWGGQLRLDTVSALWSGLSGVVSNQAPLAWAFYALLAVSAALGAWAWRTVRGWWAFAVAWLVLYGGFFWWWEPWNIEFWIALLPLAALIGLLALRAIRTPAAPLVLQIGAYATSAAAFGVALWLYNAHFLPLQQISDPANDYYYNIARTLPPVIQPHDLIVTRGNILDLYAPYYARHDFNAVISLQTLRNSAGDGAFALLIERLRPAYLRGQIIYIDQMLLDEPRSADRNPFGLTAAEIAALRAEFPIVTATLWNNAPAFYSIGQRLDQYTLAWDFTRDLQGWLAANVQDPRFGTDGWCFSANSGDPWLASPPLTIPAAQRGEVQLQLRVEGAATAGQLFWRGTDETFSEDRTLTFDLQQGTHSYTLDLRGRWQGRVAQLRLDPIDNGSTADVCVLALAVR
jgi:hypothetical protein